MNVGAILACGLQQGEVRTCVKALSQVTLPPCCAAAARPSLYMRDTSRVRAAVMARRSCGHTDCVHRRPQFVPCALWLAAEHGRMGALGRGVRLGALVAAAGAP